MATALETKAGQLETKRTELADIFDKSKTADGTYNLTPEQREDVKSRNDELTALGKEYDDLRALDQIERKNREGLDLLQTPSHPSAHGNGRGRAGNDGASLSTKSLGDRVLESPEFKQLQLDMKNGGSFRPFKVTIPDWDIKTTMTETGAGFAPPNNRTGVIVMSPQRRPVVADLIPQDPTDLQVVKFMLETTFTNNAAMAAEASAAGESALAFTEQTQLVEWLPTILPVTDQQMEDVPSLNGLINNRLTLMILLAEETELLTGSGTSPHLAGFLNLGGILTQATGTDPVPDAIMKAMTKVRFTGFANPSGLVIHPNNWQTIRLLRTSTGQYLWGSPSEGGPERIWGMPSVVTPAITANTSLLGDFLMYAHISRRRGIRVEVGFINDDFKKGQKTLRADERLSLECYRQSAFCTVTGMP